MLEKMVIESVNIGKVETLHCGERSLSSGINKIPTTGPVHLGEMGIDGDAVVDLKRHGGADQAVYAYGADDYDWWARETGRSFEPGLFGENLTIRGLPSDMNIGDRLLIGAVLLEVTAPRIPCRTLAAKMQDTAFGLAFRKARRPGIYCRVLHSGDVNVGDVVTLVPNDAAAVTVLELFQFHYSQSPKAEDLRRYLAAPIASRIRARAEEKLEKIETPNKSKV